MFLSEWREFPSASCLAGNKKMTSRASMLLKSRVSVTCFRACFLPGRAKDLSTPRYYELTCISTIASRQSNAHVTKPDTCRNIRFFPERHGPVESPESSGFKSEPWYLSAVLIEVFCSPQCLRASPEEEPQIALRALPAVHVIHRSSCHSGLHNLSCC